MNVLQRVLALIPKKASREERTFYSELLKAVDSSGNQSQSESKAYTDQVKSDLTETISNISTSSSTSITADSPQTPTGFTASSAFTNVVLEWDSPTYSGHDYAEIFRADTDDFATAQASGVWLRSYANIINDSVDAGTTHYYWVRFVNLLGQAGAFNSPTGTEGTTSQSVEQLIQDVELASSIDPQPFAVIGGNTYIKNAYIKDLTADNIASNTITADKISVTDLSAMSANMGDITSGSLNIGNGNLTIDSSGNLIAKSGVIQSSNYIEGTMGFRLDSSVSGSSDSPNIDGAFINGGEINGAIIRGSSIIFTQQLRATSAGEPFYSYGVSATSSVSVNKSDWVYVNGWRTTTSGVFGYYAYNALPNGLDEPDHYMTNSIEIDVNANIKNTQEISNYVRGVDLKLYSQDGTYLASMFSYYGGLETWTITQNGITAVRTQEGIIVSGSFGYNLSGHNNSKIKIIVGVYAPNAYTVLNSVFSSQTG